MKKNEEQKSVQLTPEKIKLGIVKLERRIQDLQQFDVSTLQGWNDPGANALKTKINETLSEIFGHNTTEFNNHAVHSMIRLVVAQGRVSAASVQAEYKKGIKGIIIKLTALKEILEEKIHDIEGIAVSDGLQDFWSDIHPKIVSVAKSRFETKHYADSVEASFKEVNACVKDIVKRKTGNELDGAPLMYTAFSPKSPIITLEDLSTESGRNVQQGYMEIFAGSMIGIRNPKAHDNLNITDIRARHFIYLASLLMCKVDERV